MNAVWQLAEQHRNLFPGDSNPGSPPPATRSRPCSGSASTTPRSSTSTASARWSTPWAGSTSTSRNASRSAATSTPAARSAASPAGHQRRARSTSTATTPSGSPGPGPPPTTSAGCAASAAWSAPSSTRSTRSTMLEKYPALASVAKNNIQTDIAQRRAARLRRPSSQRMQKRVDHQPAADQQEHQRREPRLRQDPRDGAVRHRDSPADTSHRRTRTPGTPAPTGRRPPTPSVARRPTTGHTDGYGDRFRRARRLRQTSSESSARSESQRRPADGLLRRA